MSESWLKSAPESMKVHSFDYGAWFRHVITRVRQAGSVGFFNVVHGELELTVVCFDVFPFFLIFLRNFIVRSQLLDFCRERTCAGSFVSRVWPNSNSKCGF